MEGLTINEAAATTGWSARMLRYLEEVGLIEPPRSGGGYRIYGPAELQRLRTLRELLDDQGLQPSDVALAKRLQEDDELHAAVERWLAAEPQQPPGVSDWLRWEQEKHQRLLGVA